MSKVDDILDDELDPEDLDPTPRGGKNGRDTEQKTSGKFMQALGARIGFAGIVAVTAGAALLGAAGCRLGESAPSGQPTCDEPASWCGAAEAVQR